LDPQISNLALLGKAEGGKYYPIKRDWKSADRVKFGLDVKPRVVKGQREADGKVSILEGPILLALDGRFGNVDKDVPTVGFYKTDRPGEGEFSILRRNPNL